MDENHTGKSGGVNRRGMMGRIGAGVAGAAAASAMAAGGLAVTAKPAQALHLSPDADILNFALNLEYLEAEFYLKAFFGTGLEAQGDLISGTSPPGGVIGGRAVPFRTPAIQAYAQRLASDELTHVKFLRAALGPGNRVSRPTIDLQNSFNALSKLAGLGDTFDPFADEVSFLLGAFIFEDVGVTAYAGAARFIDNADFLEAAAGILAVEAYHAGTIRTVLAGMPLAVRQAANSIAQVRADVGGGKEQGVIVPGNFFNTVAADTNALGFRRSATEVLRVVYGGGTTKGGFFPDSINGNVIS